MTCREKLAIEFPERVDPKYTGGCNACPNIAGYLDEPDYCEDESIPREVRCTVCWNREIPEEPSHNRLSERASKVGDMLDLTGKATKDEKKFTYEHFGERMAKVKDIVEENGGITAVVENTPAVQAWIEHMEEKEPHILDSGDRTQFESGAVRDMREGKGRCDLMPLEVVGEIMGDPIIINLKTFLSSKDTTYLYNCLASFAHVYDDGKTKVSSEKIFEQRYYTMFLEVAKHFEEGAKKYGESNWQKGIPVHCYIDSAVRHYLKWLRGDKDEYHDRAFVWNLMCCIWEVDYHEYMPKDSEAGSTNVSSGLTVTYGDREFVRLGDCPVGLFWFGGVVYTKTKVIREESIRVVEINTGDIELYSPDILVMPIEIKGDTLNA